MTERLGVCRLCGRTRPRADLCFEDGALVCDELASADLLECAQEASRRNPDWRRPAGVEPAACGKCGEDESLHRKCRQCKELVCRFDGTAAQVHMVYVCAECDEKYVRCENKKVTSTAGINKAGAIEVSHGLCEGCGKVLLAEADNINRIGG